MMKVILVGYMGSGKSSVGKLLASKLAVPFYDLDVIIEENERQSVPELFKNKGEIYFRKTENNVFKLVLQKTEFYYHQVNHVIEIDEKSVEQLVDEIDLKLR